MGVIFWTDDSVNPIKHLQLAMVHFIHEGNSLIHYGTQCDASAL